MKNKKNHCKVHDFKLESNKQYARKETGWCLEGITCNGKKETCDGGKQTCGKEFVEELGLAKPGNGLVVAVNNWLTGADNVTWYCVTNVTQRCV
jgi:hypothetical protein